MSSKKFLAQVKTERGLTVFCSQRHDLVRIPVPPKQVESRRSKLYVSWQQVRCDKCDYDSVRRVLQSSSESPMVSFCTEKDQAAVLLLVLFIRIEQVLHWLKEFETTVYALFICDASNLEPRSFSCLEDQWHWLTSRTVFWCIVTKRCQRNSFFSLELVFACFRYRFLSKCQSFCMQSPGLGCSLR